MQVIKNVDFNAQKDDTVVGFKPLMYFCFDHLLNQQDTVALTCPRYRELDRMKIKQNVLIMCIFSQGKT